MIVGREFHEIIKSIFIDVNGIFVSEQIQVNCPKCQERDGLSEPDGKFNLEINTKKRVFRCWKCEDPPFSGGLGKLIRIFGSKIDYELYKSFGGTFFDYHPSEDEDDFIPISLPDEFISFSDMGKNNPEHIEAYKYLVVNRGLSFETILKYRLGFCTSGRYKKRIIIPSFDINGNVDYFTARNYDKLDKKRPPYDNPKHKKKNLIFNEKFINYDSVVFLVEGVFDMFVLPNAIPLLGKKISEGLFFRLKELKPYVVIILDPDAKKDEINLYKLLQNIYIDNEDKIRCLNLTGENDIDDFVKYNEKEDLINLLYESKIDEC